MKKIFSFMIKPGASAGRKLASILLAFFVLFFVFNISVQSVFAQLGGVVTLPGSTEVITASVPETAQAVKLSLWQTITAALQKAGSIAFNRTLSTVLNQIAYDAANYIGSGGQGQSPLFQKQNLGQILTNVGDEAAGQFVETFVTNLNTNVNTTCSDQLTTARQQCSTAYSNQGGDNIEGDTGVAAISTSYTDCLTKADKQATACAAKTANSNTNGQVTPSFNVCSPTSLEAKLKIGLGLVDQHRPASPDCTLSQMITSWSTDINKQLQDLRNPNYLKDFQQFFDPRSNDLMTYSLALGDQQLAQSTAQNNSQASFITSQGWTDVRDIAGNIQGVPGEAQREANAASTARQNALGKTTGDILVDASNLFLNQLYISSLNNLMQHLGQKTSNPTGSVAGSYTSDTNSQAGATSLKEVTTTLLQPQFGTQADYNILSSLSVCPDPKNPGPASCAMDNKFMQAVTEQTTVAEAVAKGYLNGDWQFTDDNSGDSYNSSYSLRNLGILRQYRILPVGWEEAAKLASDSANPRKVTLNDLISCFDPNDQYTQFSADFGSDYSWCQGLVDPNWVLKAPLDYCSKDGIGPQILSKTVTPATGVFGQTGYEPSALSIVRADGYCADNKTCIQEKADGSCGAYGYCNEEKRTWNFGNDSCQAINNSCESFTDPSGAAVSYLKNTLNYASCNANNSGCQQYALSGVYNSTDGTVAWNGAQSLYLNGNLKSCDSKDEGCTGLLRVQPGGGANLVMDSDFSSNNVANWPLIGSASIIDAGTDPGIGSGQALKVHSDSFESPGIGIYSDNDNSLLPADFQVISGQAYTVSVDVYMAASAGVNGVTLAIGDPADGFSVTTNTTGSWQHLSVTRPAGTSYNEPKFRVIGNYETPNTPGTFYLQHLKFEMSGQDTGYTSYGSTLFSEKLLPNYLASACYANATGATPDYSLKPNAPAACANFAPRCNKDDVGCDLYTGTKDNFSVAAKVTSGDACSGQCVGYDVYIAKGNYFNLPEAANLIPAKAQSCTAAVAGCNEFTNLDTLAQGGEQLEYYTSLKQCIKPDNQQCANFYSWEGTASGPQLSSYVLEKDGSNNPAVTSNDSALCNAAVFNAPVSDPTYNPDCREFYNAAGQISYHLVSRTVTCSDNCHAYRLTGNNVDSSLTQSSCTSDPGTGTDRHWDGAAGACDVCLNGGTWDTTHNACVYQAIPGEGQTCQAADNGCREYDGNGGANVRLAASYDFASGLDGWSSNCQNGVATSTVSNSKNGQSLFYNSNGNGCGAVGTHQSLVVSDVAGSGANPLRFIKQLFAAVDETPVAQVSVTGLVTQGNAYSLKFLAKAAGASDVHPTIYFLNPDTGAQAFFNTTGSVTVTSGGGWNIYQASLADLDHVVGNNEVLVISSTDGNLFLDNIVLSEITDRYYLVKGSSQVPDVCSYDAAGNYQGPDYNLGCAQYTDKSGATQYLRQFSQLCSDAAVGCEEMVDTHNSASPLPQSWKNGATVASCAAGDASCATVSGDSAVYAIYDSSKLCTASNQGCSRFGQAQGGANVTGWSDVFEINNPDQYNSIQCGADSAGCETWKDSSGAASYFKDPGFAACSYRAGKATTTAWYKVPVKRCDANGNGTIDGTSEMNGAVCTSDADCGHSKCITDNNDYPCSVSYFKTIGTGGAGNQVPVPDQDAGVCTAVASGCTEYIDPVSQFSVNLVNNPSYNANPDGTHDGWGAATGTTWQGYALSDNQQIIRLQPNTLYSLHTRLNGTGGELGHVGLEFINGVKPLANDNVLGTNILRPSFGAWDETFIFDSLSNTTVLLTGGEDKKIVELKELAVDYQLSSNIDKTSCNGLSKFDNGCVLFNERGVSGAAGPSALTYDAYNTPDGAASTVCDPMVSGSCTANTLVKVKPDRTCSKWLDCVTYIQDPVTKQKTCYAMGECDRLDDKGDCANFEQTATGDQRFDPETDKNTTGYSMLDTYNFGQMKEVGLNADVHYGFEPGDASAPICKINMSDATSATSSCPNGDVLEIKGPAEAATATDYPANGTGYLQVQSNRFVAPGVAVTLNPGTYYINYLVNTRTSTFGLKARVILADENNNILRDAVTGSQLMFDSSSVSGWTRQVNQFTIGGAKGATSTNKVIIYLSSDQPTASSASAVYFDDINIEPVLQTADGQYATRDCRLYPTTDSLSCASKSNNVVADGLQGYCLAYDPANPGDCLMWYPIDQISTSPAESSSLGYHGAAPLYYCAEVNGNFDLMEKRVGAEVSANKAGPSETGCADNGCCEPNVAGADNNSSNGDYVVSASDSTFGYYINSGCYDGSTFHPSPDYVTYVSRQTTDNTYSKYFCVPRSDRLSIVTNTTTIGAATGNNEPHCGNASYSEGWGEYDGLLKVSPPSGIRDDCGGTCSDIDESANHNPAVEVYDYNNPPSSESGLKLLSSASGNGDASLFRLTCNKFVQTVQADGSNEAWAGRVGDALTYPNNTPDFFVSDQLSYDGVSYPEGAPYSGSPYQLSGYGRDNADAIFGAASFPDGFDLANQPTPVPLRDQYSATDEQPLAGRPYGCSSGGASAIGCGLIGYCNSGNPNSDQVFCLVGHDETCKNGSTCQALWSHPLFTGEASPENYKTILSKLFLTSYSGYTFNGTQYTSDASVPFSDYANSGRAPLVPHFGDAGNPCVRSGSGISSFCPVWPTLTNVYLYYGDASVHLNAISPLAPQNFNINTKGVYRLEFNSQVDSEQQPLKSINIDWGDGQTQVITGQDQHPTAPHVFYHYYTQTGQMTLVVKITDNWGFYKSN